MPLPGNYNGVAVITPDDAVNFPLFGDAVLCDAIEAGGAGVIRAVKQDGTTIDITVVAGQIFPGKFKRVNTTGTTATVLRALYYY